MRVARTRLDRRRDPHVDAELRVRHALARVERRRRLLDRPGFWLGVGLDTHRPTVEGGHVFARPGHERVAAARLGQQERNANDPERAGAADKNSHPYP
jgi:hypothetical protein